MTHPLPETLVPHALGGGDPATARHVEACSTCRAEVARLREAAGSLRASVSFGRVTETDDCLDELTIADFVAGRLGTETRAPVVAHLLSCARCRSVVQAAGRLLADPTLAPELSGAVRAPAGRLWRRWSLPLLAAAAALALLFVSRGGDDDSTPSLRDTTLTTAVAPMPVAPRASVARVHRFVWSGVPRAARYRLRLYDAEGAVLWTLETSDTAVALVSSVKLVPRGRYFWKVEAQTEWRRWTASDLVEFTVGGPSR